MDLAAALNGHTDQAGANTYIRRSYSIVDYCPQRERTIVSLHQTFKTNKIVRQELE